MSVDLQQTTATDPFLYGSPLGLFPRATDDSATAEAGELAQELTLGGPPGAPEYDADLIGWDENPETGDRRWRYPPWLRPVDIARAEIARAVRRAEANPALHRPRRWPRTFALLAGVVLAHMLALGIGHSTERPGTQPPPVWTVSARPTTVPLATTSLRLVPPSFSAGGEVPLPMLRLSKSTSQAQVELLASPTRDVRQIFREWHVPRAPLAPTLQLFGTRATGSHVVLILDRQQRHNDEAWRLARAEILRAVRERGPEGTVSVLTTAVTGSWRYTIESLGRPQSEDAAEYERLERWLAKQRLGSHRFVSERLQFALELQPDAIVLLSDGALNPGVAASLRQRNWLHTDDQLKNPAIPVHTIALNATGGAVLEEIAFENNGQFRIVQLVSLSGQ